MGGHESRPPQGEGMWGHGGGTQSYAAQGPAQPFGVLAPGTTRSNHRTPPFVYSLA